MSKKIGCDLDGIIAIKGKRFAEIISVQLLRAMGDYQISDFSGAAKAILNPIINESDKLDQIYDTTLLGEIQKTLTFAPEYLVEREECGYSISKQYYLKIEFFNCPAEQIIIRNDVLKELREYYPRTRLFIVTPYDNVFYSLNVDDIKDGENLDLKNHTIEDMYPIYTCFNDCADADTLSILLGYKSFMKDLFGLLDWPPT